MELHNYSLREFKSTIKIDLKGCCFFCVDNIRFDIVGIIKENMINKQFLLSGLPVYGLDSKNEFYLNKLVHIASPNDA